MAEKNPEMKLTKGLYERHEAAPQKGVYAYFPGTGPVGKQCYECDHFARFEKENRGRCREYARAMDVDIFKAALIDTSTPSCKYFSDTGGQLPPDDPA